MGGHQQLNISDPHQHRAELNQYNHGTVEMNAKKE